MNWEGKMKVYVALTVASEIDGTNTIVRADKASVQRQNLELWLSTRPNTWQEKIRTSTGPQQGYNLGLQSQGIIMDCICQTNIIEIEVEDI